MEVSLNIPQGEKYTSTIGIQDTNNGVNSVYTVRELDTKTEEMKVCEAKTNSK